MNIFIKRGTRIRVNQNIKSLHKILVVFFFLTSILRAQWTTQSPVPTHLDVRGVGAPTASRVFIATEDNMFDEGGALFESTDGGNNWIHLNVPASLGSGFNGLFFLDSQRGWAYGNENYRTTDGGNMWTPLPILGSTYFMKFYSTTFGLASGNFDHYVSYDSGDSWIPSPNGISTFDFINDSTGLGVADSGLFRTTDGANTFTQVYTGVMKAGIFLSSNVAVGIADNSFIRSTDGGLTWNPVTSANDRTNLLKLSGDVVLAYGRTGPWPNYDDRILRSPDGGQTWIDLGELIPEGVFTFSVIDEQTAVASDFSGNMFRSSDAGLTWTQIFTSFGQFPSFLSNSIISFADAQTGYFGYGNGFVIKTTDGGQSWFQISSGTGESLYDIARFPNGNLIAVGDNGTVLTSNGTSPWVQQNISASLPIMAVHIINNNDVVLVDEEGQVYKSPDGGISWEATGIKPNAFLDAKDIHFTSLLDGWVIGDGSMDNVLFHTTDGGNNWAAATGFGGYYIAADFEGTKGWALNVGGRYYRSTDNGVTWIMEELPGETYNINDIDFYDETTGYAVGSYGYAARSNDGGVTWEILGTPNSDDNFTDIYMIGPDELWLSTNDDVAYYTANGGVNWAVLNIGSAGFGSFNAIAATPDGDAWTVGYQGYIEKFNGPPPPPPNRPPNAFFEYSNISLTVSFTDGSTDPDGIIVSWNWNFGDGSGSTDQNPTHTYDTSGIYQVRLTVTDDDGDSSTSTQSVAVQQIGGTFGNFTEVTPLDSLFVTPHDADFWVMTTAPGDFDSDGDLDIAVLGYYVVYNQSVDHTLVILRNDGPLNPQEWEISYIDVPLDNLSTGASDLAWGDMDGDLDLDLVVGSNGKTVLYRNDSGTLVLTDTELPGYYEDNDQADYDINSISWADFDNDGDFDLLIPSVFDDTSFTYRTALMRNDSSNGTGGRVFTEINAGFAPTSHAQSSWADFDNDQDLDLLLVNLAPLTNEGFIKRYRNDGNGVFVGEDVLGSLTVEHGEVQWGDYDGDGDLDILIAGNIKDTSSIYIDMALRIYENVNDNFIPFNVIDSLGYHGWFDLTAATWADYDSDGDMDILLAGTHNPGTGQIEGRAQIYANDGNGNFTQTDSELPAPRSGGTYGGTFSWLDIDDDGDLDYFIAGEYFVPGGNGLIETQMHIYRNDVIEQNDAPLPPTGLVAAIQPDNSVILTWIAGSDDNTPTPALTYDLVVVRNGTHTPTKIGEFVPEVLPARLPEPGNISAVTEWLIKGLPDGHYNWLLRTVDAAYVGSSVTMGEFSIGVLSADDDTDNLPEVFSLKQNYPNPFNPVTIIKYSIPKESFVSLKVYNAIGEEVIKLVEELTEAGNYNIVFDATNLASGVYFYRLQTGSFSQVKKMIISK